MKKRIYKDLFSRISKDPFFGIFKTVMRVCADEKREKRINEINRINRISAFFFFAAATVTECGIFISDMFMNG